jgi:hypothetical protein
MVSGAVEKDLRFILEPAEGARVNDAIPVAPDLAAPIAPVPAGCEACVSFKRFCAAPPIENNLEIFWTTGPNWANNEAASEFVPVVS